MTELMSQHTSFHAFSLNTRSHFLPFLPVVLVSFIDRLEWRPGRSGTDGGARQRDGCPRRTGINIYIEYTLYILYMIFVHIFVHMYILHTSTANLSV